MHRFIHVFWALGACSTPPAPPVADEVTPDAAPLTDMSVQSCGTCHDTIVQEWQASMHAHAHHDQDPIYAAMRSLRSEREGAAITQKCAQCHTPLAPDEPQSDAARSGVACAVCHTTAAVDLSHRGARALTQDTDGTVYAAEASDTSAHPVEASAALADGRSVCLACHGALSNAADVPTCTTGSENEHAGATACTTCHMPDSPGPSGTALPGTTHASHAFPGVHGLWTNDPHLGAQALGLTGRFTGDQLSIQLTNAAGHSFPTGFPGRTAILKVEGLDASGQVAWQNVQSDPMSDAPEAVFNKVYVDAEDKPTLPPYGVRIARDTWLAPGETRTIEYDVPSTVMTAELTVLYRLAPPPAFAAWGLADDPLSSSQPLTSHTVRRSDGQGSP